MIGQMPYIQVIGGGLGYLLYDTFTDTNGTLLTAHTMDVGGGWTNQIGTFDIQSNRANRASAGSPDNQSVATADAGMADYEVTCTVNGAAGSDGTGIAVRYSASNQRFYFAQIEILNNAFRIYEYNAGYTQRATASTSLTGGTDYDMVVRMEGTTITASLLTEELIYASASTNSSSTLVGLRCGSANQQRYDDFEVASL